MMHSTGTPSVEGGSITPTGRCEWHFERGCCVAGDSWRVACLGFISNLSELDGRHGPAQENGEAAALVRLLDQSGPSVLRKLKGNFVVLAEFRRDGRLLAVRDRLGGRTCFYTNTPEGWFFAPWAAKVLELSERPAEMDPLSLTAHFAGRAPPPGHSAFEGVHELRPGELLEIDASGSRSGWLDWPQSTIEDFSDAGRAVEAFRGLLDGAVEHRVTGQGPIACMLSGGMDSGPLAESAVRRARHQGRSIVPISWALPEYPSADESGWIRMLCAHLGLESRLFEPSRQVLDDLDETLVNPDWPAFNPYRRLVETCYRMASEAGCQIILNGNAGDDLYVPPELLYRGLLQQGEYRAIWRDLRHILARGGIQGVLAHPPLRRELTRFKPRSRGRPPPWLADGVRGQWHALSELEESFGWHSLPELAAQMLGPRMTHGRAHEQYFALRNGVERRDPYHDEDLVGFMLNAPASLSIRDGRTKWIMREAMKGRLPERFRLKGRTGVMSPVFSAGLQANREVVEDLLFRQRPEWQEWVDANVVRAAVKGECSADTLVIRCIGFALWLRHWSP